MYKFEQNQTPLYLQLYNQIKEDIETKLKAGAKLPSIRKLSNEYNLSKTTVQTAYNQLYAEGYIESKKNSGYFICEDIIQNFQINLDNKERDVIEDNSYKIDFFPASLSKNSFPKQTWSKLYNKVIKDDIHYGIYHDIQGELELREELAKYLSSSRNVICKPEQIILTSGFTDSLFIVSTILKSFTKKVAVEKPCYKTARKVFELQDFEIEDISINQNGLDLSLLQNISSKALYLTPSHQFPTGVTIPISNRIKLLNWAKENSVFIIEDDYDSELSYYNRPIPSMQGLDNFGNVIYLGTFSKALSPALRISYIVLPTKLLHIYKKSFDFRFSQISIDIQKTLTLFLKEGYWDKHLRKIRNINRKKHHIMKDYLKEFLGDDIKILREGSGLNILIKPTFTMNLDLLEELCLKNKIKIYFKEFLDLEKVIALGFGGFEEFEIKDAIKTFSKIWFEAKKQNLMYDNN
ncbi:MocR-like pyridoxine biosynthesis transcription factor PdxR [Aliarcobacter vitoriensis]|uniref:GntR family transcriptional regulator n=1 Tax=Aliarcobacter vitoriensis TaxID=2011099 RepID=A0A366MQE2_9BACT|nr:PLP-dependent aminotransferase family protein [Aliarcobacter vitoriensis]RBQ28247.1 GntR family transcriptional regulator [Aliarcobacter vitoriensis]